MAKFSMGYSFKGKLEIESDGTVYITEDNKEGIKVYSLTEVFNDFNGKEVSFSLKEDNEPIPVSTELA